MRDDSQKWDAALGLNQPPLHSPNLIIEIQKPVRQTLISGSVNSALALANCEQRVAWPDIANGETYALSLRRDRVLVVNGAELQDGWNDEHGLAISDVSGAYAIIQISGDAALGLLNRGTELDPALPSGSVTRLFHGYPVMIYRREQADCFRVHIERGLLDGLWGLLRSFNSLPMPPTTQA